MSASVFRFHTVAHAAFTALTCLASSAQAQATSNHTVLITGNPLRSVDATAPASVLTGTELLLKRGSTLGDTLASLPGVAQSNFGPNASRPIIRGQEGDRIRILGNAGASLDASSLSADHAVAIDPLAVERIEVLRGPAALLYGGSAVGGVVNLIDNRIPSARLGSPSGTVEWRFGGAASERGASALVEADALGLAWHADAFTRRTNELRVPAFTHPEGERRRRVVNSDAQAEGGALGASWVGSTGHAGLAFDTYRNQYGVVVEEDVRIRMRRDKLAAAGEWRPGASSWLQALRVQASQQDYEHQELEGTGEVGTTFRNKGHDLRLEATHRPHALAGGQLQGAFGAQWEAARFAALGEEAFVPNTRTRQGGAFLVENWRAASGLELSAGARLENVQVQSAGDAADAQEPRFGAAQSRRYAPRSLAVGATLPLGPENAAWRFSINLAQTQRAPTSYELFADGVHVATAVYERGNPTQALERGRSLDVGAQWRAGGSELKLSAFANTFRNYIVLLPAAEPDFVGDAGEAFPIQAFTGVSARLRGAEVQARHSFQHGAAQWELGATLDTVRGDNRSAGEPLPRLAPWRAGLQVQWRQGPWSLRGEMQHAGAQQRVPSGDTATSGWTQWHVSALWEGEVAGLRSQGFVRGTNLTDALAFNASSTGTVRGLSPLPGRGVMAGVRFSL